MAFASSLFAVMNLLARVASTRVPWIEVAAARSLVGALAALAVAAARRAPLKVYDQPKAWARSLSGTGAMLCGFYTLGAPAIALGDAATLAATTPIFIALLSPWLLRERSSRLTWIAIVVAFAGAALIIGPQLHIAGSVAAIATTGAFLSALAMIWLRKLSGLTNPPKPARGVEIGDASAAFGARAARESPEAIVLHFSIVAAVILTALALPTWRAPDAEGAALLAGAGLTGGLAQLAMTRAYALDRAARVGVVSYLGIALSHVFGATVLDELPRLNQAVGAALIVAAGISIAFGALREQNHLAGSRALTTPGS
jgi:drug/metabolite transporter (DMT)-like permease